MNEEPDVERMVENIVLAPPRSRAEIDFFIEELQTFDEVDDLVEALVRYQPTDTPDR